MIGPLLGQLASDQDRRTIGKIGRIESPRLLAIGAEGLTYGQFPHALKLANIDLDRKVLADIAMHEAEAFSATIAQAKAALPKAA